MDQQADTLERRDVDRPEAICGEGQAQHPEQQIEVGGQHAILDVLTFLGNEVLTFRRNHEGVERRGRGSHNC